MARTRRFPRTIVLAALLACSSTLASGAGPAGSYFCDLGVAGMFYLELDQDQRCATRGLAPGSASQPCTYAVESSGRIAVTSSAVPMLGRYLLKPVPSGAVGTNAKFRGPGLEAVEEVLLSDEPPRHRGWCSPS